jgi:hypothetical protein
VVDIGFCCVLGYLCSNSVHAEIAIPGRYAPDLCLVQVFTSVLKPLWLFVLLLHLDITDLSSQHLRDHMDKHYALFSGVNCL